MLNADISAIVVKKEFGTEGWEILTTITNYTLGAPAMNQLICVIFLADTMDPGRG